MTHTGLIVIKFSEPVVLIDIDKYPDYTILQLNYISESEADSPLNGWEILDMTTEFLIIKLNFEDPLDVS